ncbi:Aste57867_20927 [Aphanomyces stellatus]|uniref:Aste57867_20927 protein n=1 Tax=Aphanomyces stellatus TaxID=120398 RepID=A0A485LGX7_9STRA|nr:hypothetical protein As57867_020859 [Aphanomyces stellatus]VFT97604.1 Aste57867_20927 [Aphanomyces stellatus]
MSSPRRSSVVDSPRRASTSRGLGTAPSTQGDVAHDKHKKERFVLSTGHDAHDLLQAAETELKACSTALFEHAEHQKDVPLSLDYADSSDDDNGADTSPTTEQHEPKFTSTTKLHLNAIPRKGDRTRHMILSTTRGKVGKKKRKNKAALPGPQTYEALEALMKKLDHTLTDKDKILRQQHTIYQVAINHLCHENIVKQQESIRFVTMQQEIEHMQHHVQKNTIMKVDFDEETTPRSSVYRHSHHMAAVADLGVRIYNVGDHPLEATDRIVVARRLTSTPNTPHNKAKNNTGRRCYNEAQPRLMRNQKYIERDKEFL